MEARFFSAALLAASALSLGANYPTRNFVITAATPQLAREIGDLAETYRRDLALEWLGHELPPWREPCPVTAQVAPHLGAGGATSFMFDRSVPFGWRMNIQGSHDRLLDSVLPHEITHMLFATHFGRPLPRWADEGACTTVEHASEKAKQHQLLLTFLTTNRGIAFNQMFAMKEYPSDILPLYSQGYSLARYLIDMGGRQEFVAYVGDGLNWNNWTAATKKHYGFGSLSELQVTWLDWVRHGCPNASRPTTLLAQQDAPPPAAENAAEGLIRPISYPHGAQPAGTLLAQASSEGWYAKKRDSTQAVAAPTATTPSAAPQTPPADGWTASPRSSLTRPQGLGTPAPTAMEWTQSPSGPYLQAAPPYRVAESPAGYTPPPGRY